MNIIGWKCPGCKRIVPMEHFSHHPECGVHPDYICALLVENSRPEHAADEIGVSNGSSCPRRRAIERNEDIVIDPMEQKARLSGTAWHQLMEKVTTGVEQLAPEFGAEIEVRGIFDGLKLIGYIDRVRLVQDKVHIEDHKVTADSKEKDIKKFGPSIEYRIQLSLYAEMYTQTFSRVVDELSIWWWFHKSSLRQVVERLSIEECMNYHPFSGDFSVRELYQQGLSGVDWRELPMVGKSFKFGTNSGCDYCDVRSVCWIEETGAPF